MPKCIARKPKRRTGTYLKYGFVVTEHEFFHCPRCGGVLSAGPCYAPDFCQRCGQKLNFKGIRWKPDKELGYAEEEAAV